MQSKYINIMSFLIKLYPNMSLFLQNHFLHTWPLQATLRILDLLTREVFFLPTRHATF